jgi:hypothetical protein
VFLTFLYTVIARDPPGADSKQSQDEILRFAQNDKSKELGMAAIIKISYLITLSITEILYFIMSIYVSLPFCPPMGSRDKTRA